MKPNPQNVSTQLWAASLLSTLLAAFALLCLQAGQKDLAIAFALVAGMGGFFMFLNAVLDLEP